MGKPEKDLINYTLLNQPENVWLFRSNSGVAWAGKATRKGRFTIIPDARPFHGMPEGWPDLTGWTTITITPDMVGQTVAVFTAIEVKATGKLSMAQERFRALMTRMGCNHTTLEPDPLKNKPQCNLDASPEGPGINKIDELD